MPWGARAVLGTRRLVKAAGLCRLASAMPDIPGFRLRCIVLPVHRANIRMPLVHHLAWNARPVLSARQAGAFRLQVVYAAQAAIGMSPAASGVVVTCAAKLLIWGMVCISPFTAGLQSCQTGCRWQALPAPGAWCPCDSPRGYHQTSDASTKQDPSIMRAQLQQYRLTATQSWWDIIREARS